MDGLRKLLIWKGACGAVAPEQEVEAEGNPVQFSTPLTKSLVVLKPTFSVDQPGSGDPSTSNIRPITTNTNCVLYHSGPDTSDYDTYTIALPTYVQGYGWPAEGYVDFVNGKVHVTKWLLKFSTSLMNNDEEYPGWKGTPIRDIVGAGFDKKINIPTSATKSYEINTQGSTLSIIYFSRDNYGLSQTEWQALDITMDVVAPLATPVDLDITPVSVITKSGVNNLWSNLNGDIELTYLTR